MDFYQGVVTDFLRADRTLFLNTECCIQLNVGENPDSSGPHWYCDVVAVSFSLHRAFLCEISYSKSMYALLKRLSDWRTNWSGILAALQRDCMLPREWPAQPWLFIPSDHRSLVEERLPSWEADLEPPGIAMPRPLITDLESVVPWKYRSWDRKGEWMRENSEAIVVTV